MPIESQKSQELIKLDAYDKKIFWELALNSRIPRSKLAKNVGISKERLHYKINRLKENLIDPAIILSYYNLGLDSYMILLDNIEDAKLVKMREDASIFTILQTIGKCSYIVYAVTENIKSFCQEFLPNQHFEILPITRSIPDNYNPFNLEVQRPEPIKKDKPITLDKKDYKLLYHLSITPLASIIELNKKTGLDPKTIKSRIERMLDANIIQKIRFALNVFKIGVTAYILKLDVVPKNKEKILRVARENNYSGIVYETYTGFVLWYMPPSHKELFEFTSNLEHLDKTIKIDAMQAADILELEAVPKEVLQIFEDRMK